MNSDYPNYRDIEEGNDEGIYIPSSFKVPSAPMRMNDSSNDDRFYSPPPYDNDLIYDNGNLVMVHSESAIFWALVWMCIGFLVWPCFIVSFVMIRPIKRDLSSFSEQYCKVMGIYGIDVAGMVIGTIGTIILIIEIVYKYTNFIQ